MPGESRHLGVTHRCRCRMQPRGFEAPCLHMKRCSCAAESVRARLAPMVTSSGTSSAVCCCHIGVHSEGVVHSVIT